MSKGVFVNYFSEQPKSYENNVFNGGIQKNPCSNHGKE